MPRTLVPGRAPCPQCGSVFATNRPQRQRFCSRLCAKRWNARHKVTFKGRLRTLRGYVLLSLPDHPMATRDGYVFEHRVVMAEKLGRMLLPTEVVDHVNGIKDDNRPENLRVLTKKQHDALPSPLRPVVCPNCDHTITVTGGLRVVAVTPPGRPHPVVLRDGTVRESVDAKGGGAVPPS